MFFGLTLHFRMAQITLKSTQLRIFGPIVRKLVRPLVTYPTFGRKLVRPLVTYPTFGRKLVRPLVTYPTFGLVNRWKISTHKFFIMGKKYYI